jgi:hypothetical protein
MARGRPIEWDSDNTPKGDLISPFVPRYKNLVRDLEAQTDEKPRPLFELFREMLPEDPESLPMLRPAKPRGGPTEIVRKRKRAQPKRIAKREIVEHVRDATPMSAEVTEVELPAYRSLLSRCMNLAGFALIAVSIGPTQENAVVSSILTDLFWLGYEQLLMRGGLW